VLSHCMHWRTRARRFDVGWRAPKTLHLGGFSTFTHDATTLA